MRSFPALFAFGIAIGLVACQPAESSAPSSQGQDTTSEDAEIDGTPTAAGVVALLADGASTLDVLTDDVGLDTRAAGLIVGHRDGLDRVPGTADDDPIGSIAELSRIPYVGPASIDKLARYAAESGFVPEGDEPLGVYEGVPFTVDEAKATVALVNECDAARLEGYGVSHRAAMIVGAAAPLRTVLELSQLKYVGTATLEILKLKAQ